MTRTVFTTRPKVTLGRAAIAAAAIFAIVNLVVGGVLRGDDDPQPARATDEDIQAFLAEQIRDAGYPGASFAIVRDGRVTLSGGIGRADASERRVTADTPFVIGSLSKAVTATALMQLVEAGRVDLDAPVTRYLPDFAVSGPGSDRITLRHLLHHTSGLPPLANSLSGSVTTLAAQVDALRSVRLATEPGSAVAYSNANYNVVGLVVERVSGQPFGSYVEDHVFGRLGMDHSHADLERAVSDGLTDAHRFWFGIPTGGEPLWRPDFLPSGWLISSAADVGRFLAANQADGVIDGARLLSPAGIDELHRGAVRAGRGSYGMGWMDGSIGDTRIVSHSGSTTDMASAMYLAPDENLGIVVLFNGQSVVYELLHKGEAIVEAAMAQLIGEPAGGTLGALYPAFTAAVVLMVALQLRGIVRSVRRVRRGEPAIRPVLGSRSIGVAAAALSMLIVPAYVLWTTPETLGAPWSVLVHIDLGQALAAYAVLQLVSGTVIVAPLALRLAGGARPRVPRPATGQGVG